VGLLIKENKNMEDLKMLVAEIEELVNSFMADAKKEVAPASAWQRARKTTITLQKLFKQFRSLSVAVAKELKNSKKEKK
jgi:ElaB/YqjD/DUF883 family membrane-anchored ribosome-binding protein